MPDDTHEKMVAEWMKDPAFKAEYERIEREEMPMLDMILAARKEARVGWNSVLAYSTFA